MTEKKTKSPPRSRSFFWLERDRVINKPQCTKYVGHEMDCTDVLGTGILDGTRLWVCPRCEPRVGGRWLADVEWEKEQKQWRVRKKASE